MNINNDKMVLLNGAKMCGKDAAINHLCSTINMGIEIAECKDHLHVLTQSLFNVPSDHYVDIYEDRSLKEKSLPEFRVDLDSRELIQLIKLVGEMDLVGHSLYGNVTANLSIRQAMIYVSEILCKPRFGSNYFGNSRVSNIRNFRYRYDEPTLWIDGSAAFVGEIPPLFEYFNEDQVFKMVYFL